MPIKGLQTDTLGLPEAGRIRLGTKKVAKNGKEYPAEADHFVLADAPDLIPHYGTTPKELLVYLPFQERDRNLSAYYMRYRSGALYCKGDGDNIEWCVDPGMSGAVVVRGGVVAKDYIEEDGSKYGRGDTVACSGENRVEAPLYPRCAECDISSLLYVIVRDPKSPLNFVNNRPAYYRIHTGSSINVRELTNFLNTVGAAQAARSKGLSGVPLILKRVPGTVTVNTKHKDNPDVTVRSRVGKYFLVFEADPMWAEIASLSMAAQALSRPVSELMALPDGSHEFDDDDVIDGDGLYVPEETQEVDERLANQIADLEAMKDELPSDWKAMHMILEQFHPGTYSTTETLLAVRKRLGIGRTDKLQLDRATWVAALDNVISTLSGGAE